MKIYIYLFFSSIILSSCFSSKKLVYLQDKDLTTLAPKYFDTEKFIYRLQPNDVLSVTVKSLDAVNAGLFNLQAEQNFMNVGADAQYLQGYSINQDGFIKLPILGDVKVSNLSVEEAQRLIQEKIDEYLVNSTVIVKMVSFKITVLGEVARPGYYFVFNGQANIFEGLGLAGDLRQSGDRRNIKLIRQLDKGTEIQLVDLTEPDLINSKFYYLLPNDVLYVEPLNAQIARENLTLAGIIFSGISTALLIVNFFQNN